MAERVSMTTGTLEHGRNEFAQIRDWMIDEDGDIYPDQLAMVFAVRLLLERTERSIQNRFDGKEDSASVARATQILLDVLHDPVFREDETA